MSEQEENELICEKLLGWKAERRTVAGLVHVAWWDRGPGRSDTETTPTFTDWSSAGLILEAFETKRIRVAVYFVPAFESRAWGCEIEREEFLEESGPLAIRAAALDYIRSLK